MSREGAIQRHEHYLAYAARQGVERLEQHLQLYLHRWYEGETARAREAIRTIMAWVYGLIELYSSMADPDNGTILSWSDARQHTMRLMRQRDLDQLRRSQASWNGARPVLNPGSGPGQALEAGTQTPLPEPCYEIDMPEHAS
jgi:hypothetical protein